MTQQNTNLIIFYLGLNVFQFPKTPTLFLMIYNNLNRYLSKTSINILTVLTLDSTGIAYY